MKTQIYYKCFISNLIQRIKNYRSVIFHNFLRDQILLHRIDDLRNTSISDVESILVRDKSYIHLHICINPWFEFKKKVILQCETRVHVSPRCPCLYIWKIILPFQLLINSVFFSLVKKALFMRWSVVYFSDFFTWISYSSCQFFFLISRLFFFSKRTWSPWKINYDDDFPSR